MSTNYILRDEIYGDILVPQYLLDLIDTKEFQRLRRIKQLGGVGMVYLGANHSRFQHSIGVYKNLYDIRIHNQTHNFSDQQWKELFCAGLLHDIGHGPLSHAIEIISQGKLKHEKIGAQIILDPTSEIHQVLLKHNIAPSKIIDLFKGIQPVLKSLLSSQLDADRMDYLLRDSYNTGTKYGLYDKAKIIKAMILNQKQICFKESAIASIESFLFARYQSFKTIYLHRTGLIFEEMHRLLFKRVSRLAKTKEYQRFATSLEEITGTTFNLQHYLEMDDEWLSVLVARLSKTSDPIVHQLACSIRNRKLFQGWKYSPKLLAIAKKKLKAKGFDSRFYLAVTSLSNSPYLLRKEAPILILQKQSQQTIALEKLSPVVKALSNLSYVNKYLILPKGILHEADL